MREIARYIRKYLTQVNKWVLLCCTVQSAVLIFFNYAFNLEKTLTRSNVLPFPAFTGHVLIFIFAFALPYFYYRLFERKNYFGNKLFVFLLVVAACLFSIKMAVNTEMHLSINEARNEYWNKILYWPLRVSMLTILLFFVWKLLDRYQPFYGMTTKDLVWKPYWVMLLVMTPLIAAAATQPDFLMMYPKLKTSLIIATDLSWFQKLLFEISYGTDFFSIELFFRGFLILGFIKWAGKDAILPMACFYCTIHFGKPLGECISSYFGGIILGIVVSNTRSIWGGLMVHLGIAWLMEIGGYIGNAFSN